MITIRKYKINPPETASPPPGIDDPIWMKPQAIPFEALTATYDMTNSVIENTTEISFRVELDDPLNYISTSGSIEIDTQSDLYLANLLNLEDLQSNVLIIQIYREITGGAVADFLGIVDPRQSYYDKINQTYHLYFYDLFSYTYNHLSEYLATVEVGGTPLGDGLPYYIEFLGEDTSLDFFLRTYNGVGDSVATDLDLPFTVSYGRMIALVGLTSINHFLDQVRNHFGAYTFIDGNGAIRLISRNRGELNAGAIDITDNIIEEDYTENYTMPVEYNAVRCSAIIDDPEGTTIADHLIYYDGEVKHKFIYYNTDLSSFNYLDLRVDLPLGGLEKYYIFPNRTIDDLKTIYSNIITPQNIVKCKVNRIDLPILARVIITEGAKSLEYNIMNIEKYYEEEYSTLELLRK